MEVLQSNDSVISLVCNATMARINCLKYKVILSVGNIDSSVRNRSSCSMPVPPYKVTYQHFLAEQTMYLRVLHSSSGLCSRISNSHSSWGTILCVFMREMFFPMQVRDLEPKVKKFFSISFSVSGGLSSQRSGVNKSGSIIP